VPERPAGYALNDIDETVVNEGVVAPDWTLRTLDGSGEISLSDHRGEVVVLEFFATWCPICRAAMPVTERLTEEFAGQPVRFLAINAYETGDVARFVEEVGIGYPVLVEGDVVADRYVAVYTPTTIVIDRSGIVVHREGGNPPGREQTLRSVIRAALGR
jgi:thiol-disulfide isomerase/thioredoxin